jgi:parallel beta-helix repeat protein
VITQSVGKPTHFNATAAANAVSVFEVTVIGHPYRVTNVEDDGPGSLRQALLDINRDCPSSPSEPCGVFFEIDGPVPEEGWFTIRPRSALPVITAYNVVIDGRTQSRFTGQTNRLGGPEIMLDGSAVSEGDGLVFRNVFARVTDLAIGGFPGNGIDGGGRSDWILRNYVGVDPSGMKAVPNGLRGVQIEGQGIVSDNILSGNRRSGGFFWTSDFVRVSRNRVGVGADDVTPIGNGASGLLFHKPNVTYDYAIVEDNIIANNERFGIALTLRATGNFARNTIYGNGGEAIDVELDGPTLQTKGGVPGEGGVVGAPTITSARYENGTTIIEGHTAPRPTTLFSEEVYVYANRSLDSRGLAQAEELIGIASANYSSGEFSLRLDRDLRGRYIDAVTLGVFIEYGDNPLRATSELGLPLQVAERP